MKNKIIKLVNKIIDDLSNKPNESDKKLIDNEPINWIDVTCYDVKEFVDGGWMIYVEGAAPGRCPELCNYIENEMKKLSYDVEVITEW